jgi:hypothetical protein
VHERQYDLAGGAFRISLSGAPVKLLSYIQKNFAAALGRPRREMGAGRIMGCNAWNHPAGCNCGWGGVYHGPVATADRQSLPLSIARDVWRSFSNPNARCVRPGSSTTSQSKAGACSSITRADLGRSTAARASRRGAGPTTSSSFWGEPPFKSRAIRPAGSAKDGFPSLGSRESTAAHPGGSKTASRARSSWGASYRASRPERVSKMGLAATAPPCRAPS